MPTTPTTEHDPKADPLSTEPGPFGDGVPPESAEDDFTDGERLAADLASNDRGYPILPGDPLTRSYTVQAKIALRAVGKLKGTDPEDVDSPLPGGVPASSQDEIAFNPHVGPGSRNRGDDSDKTVEERVKEARKDQAKADKASGRSGKK